MTEIRPKCTYKCTDKDTVAGLAVKFGMTPAQFTKLNRLAHNSQLFKDQIVVYLPSNKPAEAKKPPETPGSKNSKSYWLLLGQEVPLLSSLRTKFDKHYCSRTEARSPPLSFYLSPHDDGSGGESPHQSAESTPKLSSLAKSSGSNMIGFRTVVPEQLSIKEADVHSLSVWYIIDNNSSVLGTLTTGLGRIVFEAQHDSDITKYGAKACTFSCGAREIFALQYIELSSDAKLLLSRSPEKPLLIPDNIPEIDTLEFVFKLTIRVPPENSQILYFLMKREDVGLLRETMEQLVSSIPEPTQPSITIQTEVEANSEEDVEDEIFNFVPELDRKSEILNEEDRRVLCSWLPERYQLSNWVLLYGTQQHGISMNTFYRNAEQTDGPSIAVVRTTNGEIFGAFASEPWRRRNPIEGFYGTGECFLFQIYPVPEVYYWKQHNNSFQYSTPDEIAMGCGRLAKGPKEEGYHGGFGLWVDSEFLIGYSSPCATFENASLAETEQFEIIFMEFWGIQTFTEDD